MGNLQEGVLGDLGLGSVPTFILYANRLVRRKKSEAFRVILYFYVEAAMMNNSSAAKLRPQRKHIIIRAVAYLSWKCLDGTSPARRLLSPTRLACHHVGSSWVTTCRMSPRLKGRPASWHGVALSSKGM